MSYQIKTFLLKILKIHMVSLKNLKLYIERQGYRNTSTSTSIYQYQAKEGKGSSTITLNLSFFGFFIGLGCNKSMSFNNDTNRLNQ
jgi:hypothetical protein